MLFALLLCLGLSDNVNGVLNCQGMDFADHCVACTQIRCLSCEPQYILVEGICQQVNCNDPNCVYCLRNAAICNTCRPNYAVTSLGEC